MARKLVELWDPMLEVKQMTEPEVLTLTMHQMREPVLVCLAVAGFKRRLSDGSDQELAADKQLARTVAAEHAKVYLTAEGHQTRWDDMWESFREEARSELMYRQEAAVLRWADWLAAAAAQREREAVWNAGWVMKFNTTSQPVRAVIRQLDDCRERLLGLAVTHVSG